MSNDEFTPTEWEVREQYAAGNIHAEAEFDRMIAEVERAAAARVTPRREQIAEVLDGDRYYDPDQISNLDRADAILALMQELAEGGDNG